jgi:hypothetical protein
MDRRAWGGVRVGSGFGSWLHVEPVSGGRASRRIKRFSNLILDLCPGCFSEMALKS